MDNGKTYLSQPIKIMIDTQLGPDGHPWVRMQFATIGMQTGIVFPLESAEDIIANISTGIRKQATLVGKKKNDTVVPDFTGVQIARPS